jgi:putative transposase
MITIFKQRFRVESNRLPGWDYSARGWYFVTLCTKNKQCFLRRAADGRILLSEAGIISENEMKAIPNHYDNVVIDRYAILLNHVHALIVIEDRHAYSPDPVETELALFPKPLSQIVGGDKSGVTRSCPPGGLLDCARQPRFYDNIARSNASVNAIRNYIERNPQNWLTDPEAPIATVVDARTKSL